MQQHYSKKKNTENEPRPIVIRRIIAFSKYYEQNKSLVEDSVINN